MWNILVINLFVFLLEKKNNNKICFGSDSRLS